jgi:hypothetical protein
MTIFIGILATGLAAITIAMGVALLGEWLHRRRVEPDDDDDDDKPLTLEQWARRMEGRGQDNQGETR